MTTANEKQPRPNGLNKKRFNFIMFTIEAFFKKCSWMSRKKYRIVNNNSMKIYLKPNCMKVHFKLIFFRVLCDSIYWQYDMTLSHIILKRVKSIVVYTQWKVTIIITKELFSIELYTRVLFLECERHFWGSKESLLWNTTIIKCRAELFTHMWWRHEFFYADSEQKKMLIEFFYWPPSLRYVLLLKKTFFSCA